MKNLVILLALAAATPALAQAPIAPASVNSPAPETMARASWQFTPDFLRDENRIIWSAPSSTGANEFFVATTTGAGALSNEVVSLPANNGKGLMTQTVKFNKNGEPQGIELYDVLNNQPVLVMPDIGDGIVPLVFKNSFVSLETVAANKRLAKRTFALDFPQLEGTLTSDYDARGRRKSDVFAGADGKPLRTINYVYDARGLNKMTDGATTTTIERDAKGGMRALTAIQNGLLTRSATPIKNEKGAIIGTRIEDYSGGIMQEVNEWTRQGGTSDSRTSETSSTTTKNENGAQTTENKFDFRMDIGPRAPGVAAIEVRERTVYRNAKIASEEIFHGGQLMQRSEFNANGVISKLTNFDADGKVSSEFDAGQLPYVDGSKGIIRRSNP